MGKRVPFGYKDSTDWRAALIDIQCVIDACRDVPSAGEEFANGVAYRLGKIHEKIEKTEKVSDRQLKAIENMTNGIEAWLQWEN